MPQTTDLYLIPVGEETSELVPDLLSINGYYRGRDTITSDQELVFENLEGDIVNYKVQDLSRLVNLNSLTVIDVGDVSGEELEGSVARQIAYSSEEEEY